MRLQRDGLAERRGRARADPFGELADARGESFGKLQVGGPVAGHIAGDGPGLVSGQQRGRTVAKSGLGGCRQKHCAVAGRGDHARRSGERDRMRGERQHAAR